MRTKPKVKRKATVLAETKRKPSPGLRTRAHMSVGRPQEAMNFVLEVG